MADLPRLNSIIGALETGGPTFVTFVKPEIEEALALSTSDYDGLVFEMEHNPWSTRELTHCLQYLLNRQNLVSSGSLAAKPTPMVRIPPNGADMNQWVAKQALDMGVYGIIWPHISTVEQAANAVGSCRFARPKGSPNYEPVGVRGDGPTNCARYWGLDNMTYYSRADVWPLDPKGEVFVVLMIEDKVGVDNLKDILKEVPGIGAILIGEGDLSQDLGHARDYDHPVVAGAMAEIRARCHEANVVVGHPHADANNMATLLEQGYRFLMSRPTRNFSGLEKGRELTKG